MKTQEQIVERIEELGKNYQDLFGFQRGDLIEYLTFDNAKQFLNDPDNNEDWTAASQDRDCVVKVIKNYLEFAWDKANNCRGLSADRSIQHFLAWTWLIDDDFYKELAESYDINYRYYGKPQLVLVSEKYGFDWKSHDNGQWQNDELSTGISAEKALAS